MSSKQLPALAPERFLRQLWKHEQLKSTPLHTLDGRPLAIVSPGTANADAGPDFTNALVKIGTTSYRGDVELHQSLGEWSRHAHNTDPRYNRVILHVVFASDEQHLPSLTKSKRSVPVLVLSPYLRGTLGNIWEKMILGERSEQLAHIKCFSANSRVSAEVIHSWLDKLAIERIELKIRRFEQRIRELAEEERLQLKEPAGRYGTISFGLNPEDLPPPVPRFSPRDFSSVKLWNQLVYEGVMEALGYSKNREPFLRLARSVRLDQVKTIGEQFSPDNQLPAVEAFLFGAAGLLKLDLRRADPESKHYVRERRSIWKDIQSKYHGETLHRADWQFFRLRPENFPTVRLAAAARLIPRMSPKDFFRSIIQTVKNRDREVKDRFNSLESMFVVHADEFWLTHFRLEGRTKFPLTKLIGNNRARDILLNVLVPICLLYARIFKDKEMREGALSIFEQSPPLSENAVTRTMERQLLKRKLTLDSALRQQGALQLYKFYCMEERCKECAIGKILFT